jgi:hypothetical protein
MDSDGACRSNMRLGTTNVPAGDIPYCASYCEVRNYFFYDREVPFTEFSSCRANEQCSFSSSHAVTITKTYDFNANVGLKKRDVDNEAEIETRDLFERDEPAGFLDALKSAFSFVRRARLAEHYDFPAY